MTHSPISILSHTDFNGRVIPRHQLDATFDAMMDEHGYVVMTNVPDAFDPVAFSRRLGPFVPNYTGAIVGDVRPEPGMDDVYHAGNTRPLTPHTEGYDFETVPPRFIVLWCVQPAEGEGGETTIADTSRWVAALTDRDREHFEKTEYAWKTTDGVQRMGLELNTSHPVLASQGERTIVRFSCNNLLCGDDPLAIGLQQEWRSSFDREHVAVTYERNDVLVWDNWRLLHARNAFSDRRRHLRRIQVGVRAAPSMP